MRKYDGLFIFAGTARDEVLDKVVEAVSAEITNLSGTILSTEMLGKKTFARPMQKRDNGFYVKIRFEVAPEAIEKMKKRYKLMDDVFRVQILAVDEQLENRLAEQTREIAARAAARAEAEEAAAAQAAEAAAEVEQATDDDD